MITAIIVDDEPYCCEVLSLLLHNYCPEVQIIHTCYSGEEAVKAIKDLAPNLVFLDIHMPGGLNGFEVLEQLPAPTFDVIFVTAFDNYAVKAFHCNAIDYLLKPVNPHELQNAVHKVLFHSKILMAQQLEMLWERISHPSTSLTKIAMPTLEGLQMIDIHHIISCESDSNYTILSLKDKQRIVVSRTLKEIEEMLDQHHLFLRVHHSHLVNVNEINKYIKGEGGYLIMSDGSTIDVSRSKKEVLMKKLLHNKK